MAISEYKTQGLVFGGAIYQRVFCVTNLGGLYLYLEGRIHGGAYFRNFAVVKYGKISNSLNTMAPNVKSLARFKKSTSSRLKSGKRKAIG